jgi:hypothetical protein
MLKNGQNIDSEKGNVIKTLKERDLSDNTEQEGSARQRKISRREETAGYKNYGKKLQTYRLSIRLTSWA